MQGVLHATAEFLIGTGDDRGGQCVLRHLTRQVRTGQHTDAGLRRDLLENLAHQLEALRLDPLGRADQQLAAQRLGHWLQGLAQRDGGSATNTSSQAASTSARSLHGSTPG